MAGKRKIRMSSTLKEEQKLDSEMERSDNFSILIIVGILAICFVVGISLGYVLYKIAINGVI